MANFSLLSVIGIEIEYMLVDQHSLNVRPLSDIILKDLAGEIVNEVELDDICISNELVMHVIELKNNGPKPPSAPIAQHFQKALKHLLPLLANHQLQLLPTGAHPWMDPLKDTVHWPHNNKEIYQQYDRIFNCKGHGWSNLQSMHINLPFSNDHEFTQLHNAIRLILPLLPALAASTPCLEGQFTGYQCTRLNYYDHNQARIPSISGSIIPEFVQSEAEYQEKILQPMYQDILPFDPNGLLQYEWLNSRAAIPKFDYNAIEIRIVDTQECVNADIAIATAVWAILTTWIHNSDYFLHSPCETTILKNLYNLTKKDGMNAPFQDSLLLQQWQLTKSASNCRDIWSQLIEKSSHLIDRTSQQILDTILTHGNLSERIIRATDPINNKESLHTVYTQLGQCLLDNEQFHSRFIR